jgi:DNA-directed RNA polymerase subunit H (RpoH/RPB5)
MLKIQILALPNPNKKLTGVGIDVITTTTTPREVLAKIAAAHPSLKAETRALIVDKTVSIPRITLNDPVNAYYNGHLGDMYRIVDDSSTRFRIVAGMSAPAKTLQTGGREVSDKMYYSAYNTVLDMLKDRRHEGDVTSEVDALRIKPEDMTTLFKDDQLTKLNIMGVANRRGQQMYVFFLPKDEEALVSRKRSTGAKTPFKTLVNELIKTALDDYNSKVPKGDALAPPVLDDERNPDTQKFVEKIEMIIVYNNQYNDNLVKLDVPVQFFSVQQMVFNITKHMDQPSFYLLDPNKDRDEILDVLSLNGLVLDKDKPMSEFNVKDGTKLILI